MEFVAPVAVAVAALVFIAAMGGAGRLMAPRDALRDSHAGLSILVGAVLLMGWVLIGVLSGRGSWQAGLFVVAVGLLVGAAYFGLQKHLRR
jgi:dipeptide/tripeptide permease